MQRRATASPERRLGCPTSASGTTSTQRPSVITQARVDTAPISRLELEAQSAATAKHTAPPKLAQKSGEWQSGCRRHQKENGNQKLPRQCRMQSSKARKAKTALVS